MIPLLIFCRLAVEKVMVMMMLFLMWNMMKKMRRGKMMSGKIWKIVRQKLQLRIAGQVFAPVIGGIHYPHVHHYHSQHPPI